MPRKSPLPNPLPCQRIAAFQRRFAQIEAAFAAGRITPQERQARLVEARDEAGIGNISNTPEYRAPRAANLTEREFSNRRSATEARYHARKKAA